jgi:hypothetical protein
MVDGNPKTEDNGYVNPYKNNGCVGQIRDNGCVKNPIRDNGYVNLNKGG